MENNHRACEGTKERKKQGAKNEEGRKKRQISLVSQQNPSNTDRGGYIQRSVKVKNCTSRVKQARKILFKAIAVGERGQNEI